jgi:uncharacterized protein (TIGR03118 family)
MFHPRRFRTLLVISACATLALLLLFNPRAETTRVAAQSAQAAPSGPGQAYVQTNLVSDVSGLAQLLDPFAVNIWGITRDEFAGFPALVHTGTGTFRRYDSQSPLSALNSFSPLAIPGSPPLAAALVKSSPFEGVNDFLLSGGPATIVFASPAGEISAWEPGLNAARVVLRAPGRMYTGVAIADHPTHPTAPGKYLYAADFANGKIDVYNGSFVLQTSGFAFADPTIPPDYHPYNIQRLDVSFDAILYVTYAKPGPGGVPLKGPGLGYVRVFNPAGVLMPGGFDKGELNAPWGLAVLPVNFGVVTGELLVANTGDGRIISQEHGPLLDPSGNPIVIEGLHGLSIFVPFAHFNQPGTLLFTAGPGNGGHGIFGKIRATNVQTTSFIQFAATNVAVDEAGGHVDFTVIRTGDTSATATVNYNTFDASGAGQAVQKSDYEISFGTLTFAPGETSKTFQILVVDDHFVEGDETISLALSNVVPDMDPDGVAGMGVGLGADAATLTILDNDFAPSSSNPVDDSTFFVRQHYLDFLNREPDAAGLDFWVDQITSCGTGIEAAQCREVRRINVSAAFFLSTEFRNTGLLAYLTNKAAFGPPAMGFPAPVLYGQFMHDVQQLQKDFIFGQPGADAQLESNKQAYFAYVAARPGIVPSSTTPAQFVDGLFANAGVTPTAAERDAAIAEFGAATNPFDRDARARALRRVAENAAFANAEFRRAFVTIEYFGYLRRDPDNAGFNFWLGKLNQFNGDFIKAEMVRAFIASDEYRRRFGPS